MTKDNNKLKNILVESFGATIQPMIVAGASMFNPIVAICATA
jgi:hypothetical protein